MPLPRRENHTRWRWIWFLPALGILLASCQDAKTAPAIPSSGEASPAKGTVLPSAAAPPAPSEWPSASAEERLGCVADADCETSGLVEGNCCPNWCNPNAVYAKRWLRKLEPWKQSHCPAHWEDDHCPANMKCPRQEFVTVANCIDRVCTAVKESERR